MLQLSLRPGEYLTIHGDIVVQLAQLSGSRAFLRVEADRSIPIVRGKVLERSGGSPAGVPGISSPQPRQERPGCRLPLECGAGAGRPHNGTAPGADGGRGQPGGSPGAAAQLEHLLPTVWEEELSGQIHALFRSKTAQDV